MPSPDLSTPAPATRRDWIALATLTLPVLLIAIDSSVLNFALPAITEDLRPSADQMLWIIDIYGFMLAGLLVSMGTLGDKIGRRKLLLIGGAGFGIASALGAVAANAGMLVAARALLGIAGATLMPSTVSILRNTFHDPHQRRIAMGVWSAAFSGGAALGPIIGGLLLHAFTWHAVFLINIPVMVLLLVLAPFLVPESRSSAPGPFDLASVALALATMLPFVYGVKMLAEHPSVWAALALFSGVGFGWLFIRRQRMLAYPLLDLELFRSKVFSSGALLIFVSIFALIGGDFVLIQYLQLGLGLDVLEAALWIAPGMVAEAIAALVAVYLARKLPVHVVIFIGFLLSTAGFIVAMAFGASTPIAIIAFGVILFCWGTGTSFTLANDAMLSAAPAERAGAAAGVSETAYELGAALGIALLGTMANLVYRASLVVPDAASDEVSEQARRTIAEAVQAARSAGLPELREAAQSAYTQGTVVVGISVAVMMLLVGLFALSSMRAANIKPGASHH